MPSSAVKPVWKYSWKPEGYGIQEVKVSTQKLKKGSLLFLDHTYFRGKEFAATLEEGNTLLTVGYEDKSTDGNIDIMLRLYDAPLSRLGNSGVYRAIELLSSRVLNTTLVFKVNFIADAINPEDFGQALHKEAEVEHKSLKTSSLETGSAKIESLEVGSDLGGKWGKLSVKGVEFTSEGLKTPSFSLKEAIIQSDNPLVIQCGSSKGKIQYDDKTFIWEVWNPRAKKMVPFIISSTPADKIKPGSIPYVSGKDPVAQSYHDWFKLDEETKTLHVPHIDFEDVKIEEDSIKISGKKVIYFGKHKLQDMDGVLSIDDVLQINPKTQSISIDGILFDKELFKNIKSLQKEVEELKKMIKG